MKKLLIALMTTAALVGCTPVPQTSPDDVPSFFDEIVEATQTTEEEAPVETEEEAPAETEAVDSEAGALLDSLEVRGSRHELDEDSYERPDTWNSASRYGVDAPMGGCTIREYILYRDGENVELDDDCYPEQGTWYDDYTGITYGVGGAEGQPVQVRDLHIEHIVPLKDAYLSGAVNWTDETFSTFAHDVNNLIVSEGEGNTSKGDQSPDSWMPENEAYHCEYVTSWVMTKAEWELSVTQPEKDRIAEILSTC